MFDALVLATEAPTGQLTSFEHPPWLWPSFLVFIAVLLLLFAEVFLARRFGDYAGHARKSEVLS